MIQFYIYEATMSILGFIRLITDRTNDHIRIIKLTNMNYDDMTHVNKYVKLKKGIVMSLK